MHTAHCLMGRPYSKCRIFPGTRREGSVFIPAQYDAARPACVYVRQDGYNPAEERFLESLIAAGEAKGQDPRRGRFLALDRRPRHAALNTAPTMPSSRKTASLSRISNPEGGPAPRQEISP